MTDRAPRADRASQAFPAGRQTRSGRKTTSDTSGAPAGCVWRLWLPALLGPPRKRTVRTGGERITIKQRRLELPPGPNGSRGNPIAHARWVKLWREETARRARLLNVGHCRRVRISAVLCRRALGTADEDNDRARLKPCLDGLRDAGVIPNDTRGFVEWGSVTEERAGTDGPGVLLLVEALDHAAARPEGE